VFFIDGGAIVTMADALRGVTDELRLVMIVLIGPPSAM
jgi:hypothetical protein